MTVGYKSAVARASNKSPSVRTTIPEKIAQEVRIKPGDILDWEVLFEKDRKVMKVRKLE
jgi:hypothetical protein